jgi:hypothetical protein
MGHGWCGRMDGRHRDHSIYTCSARCHVALLLAASGEASSLYPKQVAALLAAGQEHRGPASKVGRTYRRKGTPWPPAAGHIGWQPRRERGAPDLGVEVSGRDGFF